MNPAVLSSQTFAPITFIASLLIWVMVLGLLVLWFIDGRVKKELVLHVVVAMIVSWVVSEMIKSFFPVLRPYHVNGKIPMTLTLHDDGSFPSTHSAVAFSLATTVWMHSKKYGLVFVFCAAGVSLGRVLSNVHYPFDVVGGAFFGVLIAMFINKLHVFDLLTKLKLDT